MDKERIKRRFGAHLRKLRKALGLSQKALALNCSLDRSLVGAIERGESNVGLINLNRLAERLRVKTAELFVDRRAGRWIFRGNVGTSGGMR